MTIQVQSRSPVFLKADLRYEHEEVFCSSIHRLQHNCKYQMQITEQCSLSLIIILTKQVKLTIDDENEWG